MAELFDIGIFSVEDTDGSVGAGWKLNFYVTGTSTRQDTYPTEADANAGTNANTNPVVADAAGRFPAIWLKTTGSAYKAVLANASDVVKATKDPAMFSIVRALAASTGSTLVSFLQSGSGMGTRTIQAKAREALSLGDALPAADGTTDDTTKIANVIAEAEARGGAEIFIPPGEYAYTSINIPTGVYPKGPFSGQAFGAKLICTATSGPAITITERACGLENLWLSCSDDRWNTGTPTNAHTLLITAGDIASPSALSQLRLANLQIDRSPRDGVHGVGTMELSLFENVHVRGAKRHGFAFDDGTRDGYSNIANGLFEARFVRCRAIDCGGNAGAFGRVGMTNPSRHVVIDQFEALGCAWDSAVREVTQQVLLRGDDFWVLMPDIEDQQYANSTIAGTGDAKTSRATPSGGIYLLGSGKVWGGRWSSLMDYVTAATGTSFVEIDLTTAKFFTGTYATAVAVAVTIGSSIKGILRLKTDAAITKVATVQSAGMDAWKDGVPYLTTTSTGYDVGISLNPTPTEVTIASGIATLAATSVKLSGEGAAADDCQTLRPLSGQVFPEGTRVVTHYGGEDITFLVANNFVTRTGSNEVMSSSNPVITWVSDGTNLVQQ